VAASQVSPDGGSDDDVWWGEPEAEAVDHDSEDSNAESYFANRRVGN
jgi:hypothetical protein